MDRLVERLYRQLAEAIRRGDIAAQAILEARLARLAR